jgi:hypothetical protein
MKNLTNLETKLAEVKLHMKLYKAGAVIAEAYEKELSYTFFDVKRELFSNNSFFRCGGLNLTSRAVAHHIDMTDGQDDKFLKKLKAAVKTIEKHDADWAAYEAYEDLN